VLVGSGIGVGVGAGGVFVGRAVAVGVVVGKRMGVIVAGRGVLLSPGKKIPQPVSRVATNHTVRQRFIFASPCLRMAASIVPDYKPT
jgi:hypothetical protein